MTEVDPADDAALRALTEAFIRWGTDPPLTLEITSRRDAWIVMSLLQLAHRHPDLEPATRAVAEGLGRQIQDGICYSDALRALAGEGMGPDL